MPLPYGRSHQTRAFGANLRYPARVTRSAATPPPCQATLSDGHVPCRRPAAESSIYCPTHRFLLEPLGGDFAPLSLDDELQLVRIQLHKLVGAGAPPAQILDALRTLALIARLHARLRAWTRSNRP